MKIRKILKEEGGKPYTVDHTFNITQGENKISTHVKVSVSSPDPGQSKKIADKQMSKVMSYMRSQDDDDGEDEEQFSSSGGSMARPMDAQPTETMPAQDHEEQEEEHPQSSARDFWKSKGFGEASPKSGSLSSLGQKDIEQMVGESLNEVVFAQRRFPLDYDANKHADPRNVPSRRPQTQAERDIVAQDVKSNRRVTRQTRVPNSPYRRGRDSAPNNMQTGPAQPNQGKMAEAVFARGAFGDKYDPSNPNSPDKYDRPATQNQRNDLAGRVKAQRQRMRQQLPAGHGMRSGTSSATGNADVNSNFNMKGQNDKQMAGNTNAPTNRGDYGTGKPNQGKFRAESFTPKELDAMVEKAFKAALEPKGE